MRLANWTGIDVDTKPDYYVEFLDSCSANEQIKRYKRRCYEMLEIRAGHLVLDAGCGTGTDAKELLSYVGPDGYVLGVDKSEIMIRTASQMPKINNLVFRQEDILDLQLQDNIFDRCSMQRVLQHLADPLAALRELRRVLKPAGLLLICDPDWRSFEIGNERIQNALVKAFKTMIPNYDIVWRVPELLEKAGMTIVETINDKLMLADYKEAEKILLLKEANQIAVANSWLKSEEMDLWFQKNNGDKEIAKISGKAFLVKRIVHAY